MKLLRLLMAAAMISAAAVSVQGCNSIMSKDECINANWDSRGESDGIAGKASSLITEYHEACDDYRPMDEQAYRRGRDRGAKLFCVPERLYNTGKAGTELTDICNSVPGSSELMVYYQRGQIAYLADQQLKTIDSMISIANYLLDKRRWASKQYRLLEIRNQATKLRPKAKAAVDKALRAGMKKDVDIPDLLTELNSTGQMDTIVRYGKADTELDDIEKDILDYERKRDDSMRCMYSDSKKLAKSCRDSYDYYNQQLRDLKEKHWQIRSQVGL
ncbi:MAG: DUF2799 domain-containing protein [Succinivibrionaceae bacterium]|nr:DUF2799 domain-containing protein [Succinivibrionaceae bacterium]